MRKFITITAMLFIIVAVVVADNVPEEIQALLSKESAGIQLTSAEKTWVADYMAQQNLTSPWLDESWGTDGWYSAVDQYSGGQPFNWMEISSTGTELWPSQNMDDTWSSTIPLPFTFPYYWLQRDSIKISANVMICFDNQTNPSYSLAIPSNTGHMKIDPWTYDMYHLGADTVAPSHYYYEAFGDSLFVVQFKGARYYSTTYRYDPTYAKDMEVLLYSDGRIIFQYDSLRNIAPGSPNNSGIEDSVNVNGLTCGNSFFDGQAITFTPLTGVILSNGQVNPPTGNPTTEFVYQVNYRNTNMLAPTSATIYIDDTPFALIDSTSGGGDYYMGVPFYYTTLMSAGEHDYYFQFESGGSNYRFPETGYLEGPTVYAPLTGNYDIGGGANDFNNIVEAVAALNGAGLISHVVFTVFDGIYDGQVEILNTIQGLGETATLTIQAATGVRPIVRNTEGSSTTTGSAFRIVGADYITIKGFEIDNCYYAACYVYYSSSDSSKYITIEDNYIHDIGPSYSGYGIYIYRGVFVNILNNEVQGDYYGIGLSYSNNCLVANNLVYGQDYYGIRNYASTDNKILHNSVYLNSDYGSTNYGSYFYNSSNCVVKNNIFYNGGSGSTSKYAIYISGTLTTYPIDGDYNDLYSPNSSVGYYSGAKTTLADWQTATLLDANSISVDPNYISMVAPYDLHISTAYASPVDSMGTPVAEVSVDFDYEARDATFPDIGGDEFAMSAIIMSMDIQPEALVDTANIGTTVYYDFYVRNTGNVMDDYTLWYSGALWDVILYDNTMTVINSIDDLLPGDSSLVIVAHSIPAEPPDPLTDEGYLGAISVSTPTVIDSSSFTTTAVVWPPVNLVLTPDTSSTVIPAGGGDFFFDIDITNYDAGQSYALRVWNNTILPTGMTLNLLAANLNLSPSAVFSRSLHQYVPAGAPAGTYSYMFYAADLVTWEVYDSSGFSFEKLAGDGAPVHDLGWALLGWNVESEAGVFIPTQFDLHTNFPNPFNPSTTLTYDMPENGNALLSVYDVTGREVAKLVDGFQVAGRHQVSFNGNNLSSGVYFAVFNAENFHKTQKMLLVK